jgi:replicative DNA helicase
LPCDHASEAWIIGAVLRYPSRLDDGPVDLSPADFDDERHQHIWRTVLDLHGKRRPIDSLTVSGVLYDMGMLEAVGGPLFVRSLADDVATAVGWGHYAGRVRECSIRRSLIASARSTMLLAADMQTDVEAVVARQEATALAIRERGSADIDPKTQTYGEVMQGITSAIETARTVNEAETLGFSTGLRSLDGLVRLKRRKLYVLGARPSNGKSALARQIAEAVAVDHPSQWVCYFGLEMDNQETGLRSIAARTGLSVDEILQGNGSRAVVDALGDLSTLPIQISEHTVIRVRDMRRIVAARLRTHRVSLVVADYGQLITPEDRRAPREQQVAGIVEGLFGIAKDFGVPVLVLAQVNREADKRTDKRPAISDLRESGSFEQHAHAIILLHKPPADPEWEGKAEAIVGKHRGGKTGTVELGFDGVRTKFSDLQRPAWIPAGSNRQ